MKAKILNPLQDYMGALTNHSLDLLSQNVNSQSYQMIKDWFNDCVLLYALTVATGNDTYIKTVKSVFENHISSQCDYKSHCPEISEILSEMVSLLNK